MNETPDWLLFAVMDALKKSHVAKCLGEQARMIADEVYQALIKLSDEKVR
jgi:hypothetical protein